MAAMVLEGPVWEIEARAALELLAESGVRFDAADLREEPFLVGEPSHPSKWGALFGTARMEGLIEKVGFHASNRPSRSGGACYIWRGVPA